MKTSKALARLPLGLCLLLSLSQCCAHPDYPVSDHYDGKIFHNEDRTRDIRKSFGDVLKWRWTHKQNLWPNFVEENETPRFSLSLKSDEGAVTFINHSTEVIQLEHSVIITDPVFSERVGPVSWVGPKRHRPPGAELLNIPRIDFVVLSHNHYDHMDIPSLKEIEKRDHPLFFVPLGNKHLLESSGIKNIVELDWWQKFVSNNRITFTLVPMQHWSTRILVDRAEALWGGFVIETPVLKVLFSGDTGYNRQFKEVAEKFGPMDLSILQIGAYLPRDFMKDQHMNPEDAVQAHLDLRSGLSLANHFGTFQQSDEGIDEPVADLKNALKKARLNPSVFIAPKNGQTTLFKKSNHPPAST